MYKVHVTPNIKYVSQNLEDECVVLPGLYPGDDAEKPGGVRKYGLSWSAHIRLRTGTFPQYIHTYISLRAGTFQHCISLQIHIFTRRYVYTHIFGFYTYIRLRTICYIFYTQVYLRTDSFTRRYDYTFIRLLKYLYSKDSKKFTPGAIISRIRRTY